MRSDTVRARFGRLVTEAAIRAGYDLDKRGTKAVLARDMGMTETAVGRMLSGQTLPDPWAYERIAQVVHLELRDLLIESGIASPEALSTPSQTGATGVGSDSITPEDAADALGLTDPVAREMVAAGLERQRRIQAAEREADADAGGSATAQM
ncbi:XRE family transcriptional regulator [Streptomyces sp. NPDC001594]|uniref:XRE family transcriptional regulator n=1 Tax=Streptomyces sp. NPDC001594 TaxID=3364590 RepID=UPI0036CCB530